MTFQRGGQYHVRAGLCVICWVQLRGKTLKNIDEDKQSIHHSILCSYMMYGMAVDGRERAATARDPLHDASDASYKMR